jgi:hypothetical protein
LDATFRLQFTKVLIRIENINFSGICVRDNSGNPVIAIQNNIVLDCLVPRNDRLQRIARPVVFTEGHAQIIERNSILIRSELRNLDRDNLVQIGSWRPRILS